MDPYKVRKAVTPAKAGVQTSSRRTPARSPGQASGTIPPKAGLDPGFHREPWIPAFAGMTKMGSKGLLANSSKFN
jgi:hypothetical protein